MIKTLDIVLGPDSPCAYFRQEGLDEDTRRSYRQVH